MRRFLTVILIIICANCQSQTHAKEIKENTVKLGKMEVMRKDLQLDVDNWDGALSMVKKLKNGWRLPTKKELNILYQNKDNIGGFVTDIQSDLNLPYLSSTVISKATKDLYLKVWVQDFVDGSQTEWYCARNNFIRVRVVRSIQ